ncbi:odorant receptor 4-like [Zophobas morio]|uniref:odorant receptor 4-like n=1 Tax=Zophobas morio TaxID=2755281 RepID=UPI003083D1BB
MVLAKLYYFIKNMETLKQVIETLNTNMFQAKPAQIRIVQPDLNFLKNVAIILAVTIAACVLFWCSFPLLDSSSRGNRLPFLCWYPIDTTASPGYELIYCHQVVSVFILATNSVNLDTLISGLMMLIGAQCDILCDNLRNMKPEHFNQEFVKFAETSSKFFSMIIFGQCFTSAACIAMTLFRLTVVSVVSPMSSEFWSITFYLGAAIQQIFLYCWFGNEIEIKSSRIGYAVFESDWTSVSLSAQKSMVIFVLRCQTSITMSAFNLVYLTLENYVAILRVAWSYFAVIRSFNSDE